jgi:uncharacterized protein YndB with AHSA1/START domain
MSTPPVVHGSFTIHRTYDAPIARVFAAWSDLELKARWFIGPPDEWKLVRRELDFRVGGSELLHGEFLGGRATIFSARYHAIEPDERLIYAYDMHVGGRHLSVSLATVELAATAGGGTRMTFTEQAAFLDGEDGTRSREGGTAAHLERLALVLGDRREIVSSRVFEAPRDVVFRAFSDPLQLARWWGPTGFSNTFQEFDPRPGGAWRFVMHGPDGTDYQMVKEFVEVVPPARVVFQHLQATHGFTMTMIFSDLGPRTHLTWRMRFESEEEADRVRALVAEANEQNFDRLAAHLAARLDR